MMDSPKDLPAWPDPNRYWEGCEYETELICALRARLGLAVDLLDRIADHIGDSMPDRQDEAIAVIAACREPS